MRGRIPGFKHSDETKRKIAEKLKQYVSHPANREKLRRISSGPRGPLSIESYNKRCTKEYKEKLRQKYVKPNGDLVYKVKTNYRFRDWKSLVLKRDDYTCQDCFTKGEKLYVHHNIPLLTIINKNEDKIINDDFDNISSLYDVFNGISLCRRCHALRHGKIKRVRKETLEGIINSLRLEILEKDIIIKKLQGKTD